MPARHRSALVSIALLALAGCAAPDVGARSAPIVGGSIDLGDDGVFFLRQTPTGYSCTATLISPHVVLTARHCVIDFGTGELGAPEIFTIFAGSGYSSFGPSYHVRSVHIIPGSDATLSGEDLGLVILTDAAHETPLVLDRGSPDPLVGQTVTAIGFGDTPAGVNFDKLRATGTVLDITTYLHTTPLICEVDSGAPLLGPNGHVYAIGSYGFPPPGSTEIVCGSALGAYNLLFGHFDWIDSVLVLAGDTCLTDDRVCDGHDDDCDGSVDEDCLQLGAACTDASQCASLMCADTAGGRICTGPCDATRPSSCGAGLRCARQTDCGGLCMPMGTGLGAGIACERDDQCAIGGCIDPGDGRRRCLAVCLGDAGACASDEACTAADGACGACIPLSIFGSARGLGEACDADAACRSGHCVLRDGVGECATACGAGDACAAGFVCVGGDCLVDRRQSTGGPCATSADCASGTCASDASRSWCSPADCTAGCPSGFACDASTHECTPMGRLETESCSSDADCSVGGCVQGACAAECDAPRDCAAGFVCMRANGAASHCARPARSGGGCSAGGSSRAPSALASLAVLAWALLRRRRVARAGTEPGR